MTARQKTILGVATAARVLANVLDLAGIATLAIAVNLLAGNSVDLPMLGAIPANSDKVLFSLLAITMLVFLVKTVAGLSISRFTYWFLAKIEVRASMEIARGVFERNLSGLRLHSNSELNWAVIYSTYNAFTRLLGQAISFVSEATLALLVFILFIFADWRSSLLVMVYIALLLGLFEAATRATISRSGQQVSDATVNASQAIVDYFSAFREITVMGKNSFFTEKIRGPRSTIAQAQARLAYATALPRLILEMGLILGAIGFFWMEYWLADGAPNLTKLTIFLVGSLRLLGAVLPIQRSVMDLRATAPLALKALTLISEIRSAAIAYQAEPGNVPGSFPSSVTMKEVKYRHPDQKGEGFSIDSVSLEIKSGDFVAFIGPSGAGKSTIVDLLLGLLEPSSGEVSHQGDSPQMSGRHRLGYVPQRPGLISGSIRENIALGVPRENVDDQRIWDALEIAHLRDFVRRLPNGLDTDTGKNADSFSGGQIQRLSLARSLYARPSLLVLDEATSALDAETEAAISDSLMRLKGNLTLVVVAHRLSTIKNADLIYVVDGGKIVASGSLEELRAASPIVANYIRLLNM